ncbi:hypothetical protein NQ317_005572, partial [Molorchus minor]
TIVLDISRGDSWSGRTCCALPNSESCRRACITATSTSDLIKGCRHSDEIAFFGCLDRQKDGDECCNNARTVGCKEACIDILRSDQTPTKSQRQTVKENCEITSPSVTECVKEIAKVSSINNVHEHMHCCDKSNYIKCREACKQVLSNRTIFPDIVEGLQSGGCAPMSFQDYFWQCFLKPNPGPESTLLIASRIDRVGMDSAKWHCCQKANSSQCARLCSKTFTKFWANFWDDFQYKCLTQVSEESLRTCIDEVDEPCELGCDGLSYCTNFNNRPTDLFRSCNSQADEAARNDVALWQNQSYITLGPRLTLPLKSISKCSPNVWKVVACTLQIKPCSRHSHMNQICRDVCLDILSQCVDWTRISPHLSADSICSNLSPDDPNVSCIRLRDYLSPSTYKYPRITGQVSSPCKGNPCEPNEICLINRNCIHGTNCKAYICQPGCKLGEVSQYMVPDGTYVRIPIPNNPKGCLKICKCKTGKIEDCQPLPCFSLVSCLLGLTQPPHGSTFMVDCALCSCYAGEIICNKKQCESTSLNGRNTAYTTMPCNCPPHYVPVCGRNGVTYPSACLAKCGDLYDSDIEHYPCQNPCKPNTCPIGQKCVPKPQVCLSAMHKPCTQYECKISMSGSSLRKELVLALRGQASVMLQSIPVAPPTRAASNGGPFRATHEGALGHGAPKRCDKCYLVQEFTAAVERLAHLAYLNAPKVFQKQLIVGTSIDGIDAEEIRRVLRITRHRINGSSDCTLLPKDPVCDLDNQQYDNSCLLAHHNSKLAYRGPCLNRCKYKGQVCGFNGKTYISECAAFADMIAVDYDGPCIAIGLITQVKAHQCAGVNCPKLQDPSCLGVTPPGACCPICAGSIRILYSRKQIDRALYVFGSQNSRAVNLHTILKSLERQIQLAQCTLKGYLTVELDIFVAVQTTERYPSELQLEACIREAEKNCKFNKHAKSENR